MSPSMLAKRFRGLLPVVIDVETSGLNPSTDAILEVAAVTLSMNASGKLCCDKTHGFHVEPFLGARIEKESLEITRIDPTYPLRFAIPERQALERLFTIVQDQLEATACYRAVLVGQNAWFDLSFLLAATKRTGIALQPFHRFTTFDTDTSIDPNNTTTETTTTTTTTEHHDVNYHHDKNHGYGKHHKKTHHGSYHKKKKHKHGKKCKHGKKHAYVDHKAEVAYHDYKDMGPMPMHPAPMDVCTVCPTKMILQATNQNLHRAMPDDCRPGWFHRIKISGGLNVDIGKWGDRNTGYMGENYQRFSLNDIYLNFTANINEWARAFASLSYSNPTTLIDDFGNRFGEYSAAYSNNVQSVFSSNFLQVEQAFATIGNPEMSPVYLEVGKEFQDFSRYEIHPITRSMTQVLSETLATSVKLGFIVPMGFNGSIYVFDNPATKYLNAKRRTNYGAALNFIQPNEQFGWGVGLAWLYDMAGVNDVAYNIQHFTNNLGVHSRTDALAFYGDINAGAFSLAIRYTTALDEFNALDLPRNGFADVITPPGFFTVVGAGATGAKPWAVGVEAGFGFDFWGCRQNKIFVGYQASREAAGINLPRSRWELGWNIDFWQNTTFGLLWDHDQAYSVANGGTGDNSDLVSLRFGVKFV